MEITREFTQHDSKVKITANVWEKYGKKNVYFSRAGKPCGTYSVTSRTWVSRPNNPFFVEHIERTFSDLLGLQSPDLDWLDWMSWN